MPRKPNASSAASRRAKPTVADRADNHASPRQPSTLLDAGPTPGEIAEAAYHRYLQRGGQHGSDFDDWIQAERELRERSASNPKSQ